jgi:hypothetical protein
MNGIIEENQLNYQDIKVIGIFVNALRDIVVLQYFLNISQ